MSNKKTLAVAEAINPETGEVDLMGALRFVIVKLNEEEDIERGGLYHTLCGSMQNRLKSFGIPAKYLVDFQLVMQELGVARRRGANNKTLWEVSCTTYFDAFVSEEWLDWSLHNIAKRHETTTTHRKLREQLAEKELEAAGEATLEQVAELMVEVEELQKAAADKDARIEQLEAELTKLPKRTFDSDLAAAIEKARAKRSASDE